MTKEITKAFILQQIQDKFKLRDYEHEKFVFSETVIPTYNIEQHLVDYSAAYKTVSITSGSSGYEFFLIPENERWALATYNVVFITGVYGVTGLYIVRAKRTHDGAMAYLDMTAGQTTSYAKHLPQPVILDAGDRVYLYVDSWTSIGDLRLYIDYTRVVIR